MDHVPLRLLLAASVGVWGAAEWGCRTPADDDVGAPSPSLHAEPDGTVMDLAMVSDVKRRHNEDLMAIPGVVGTGVSRDESGTPVIEVYVDHLTEELGQLVPKELEGVTVRTVETGKFSAR